MSGEDFLFSAMSEIRRTQGIALVHSEDGELVDRLEQEAIARGRHSPEHYAPTRPPEAEASAIGVVALAAQASGCPAYIVHVSSADGLATIERARHRGVRLWAETCPQYILMDDEVLLRHGPMARIAPPLRTLADRRALGAALSTGAINTLGTDHACFSIEEKARGDADIFRAPFGHAGRAIAVSLHVYLGARAWSPSSVSRARNVIHARSPFWNGGTERLSLAGSRRGYRRHRSRDPARSRSERSLARTFSPSTFRAVARRLAPHDNIPRRSRLE